MGSDAPAPARPQGCAPIVMFVYNRPDHTRRTIEALQRNALADHSALVIYSDAPKTPEAAPAVAAVRELVHAVSGFASVEVVEQERNQGLARSIIQGVTAVCERHGRVIVLEDDLVTSPHFLRYMNDALDLFQDAEQVMHVSGSAYPVPELTRDSSYFLRVPLCWGWATWARAWAHFAKDLRVMRRFSRAMIRRFNFDGTHDYWKQLELNRRGEMNTWFVFWYATVFLADGLALFPRTSMVRNIGMDGTGVHCSATSVYDVGRVAAEPLALAPIPLEVSSAAYAAHKAYFRSIATPLHTKVLRKVARMLGRNR